MWAGRAGIVQSARIMEAIVLAGGSGTRLKKIVANVPKPMAPIGTRPFLEILLSSLASKGFNRVILSLGFRAKKISDHFGPGFKGMDIAYVQEDTPLGTGGAVRLASEACRQDYVYIFNGDTYLDLEVQALDRHWHANGNTVVVGKQVDDTTRYGKLVVDGTKIIGFTEKGIAGPGLISAGCYVLASDALAKFPLAQPFSIETDHLALEARHSKLDVFITEGFFIDIGIPEDYAKAQNLLAGL